MTVKEIEAKESNLIESGERRKSVIQSTGSKLKVFKDDKYSPFHSMNDGAEISGNSNPAGNILQMMDDKQETHDAKWKKKMEYDRRVKMAHDIREKSVNDLAEKKKKQKALVAGEQATMKLAQENELEEESEWNFCKYCMVEDCVLHSGSKMSEMIKFELNSIEDLENQSMNLVPVDGNRYSLTMRAPISQETFTKLAGSPMGQNLEELVIQPLNFTHHQYTRQGPYHILRPETLTPDIEFPKLKKLLLEGLAMSKIHFVGSNFPVLEDLYIGHLSVDYDFNDFSFHLDVPTLRTLHFRHFSVGEDFAPSLSRSPKLESFRSYKFGFGNAIFILPSCRILSFCRSGCLNFLELFAPKLEKLNLQSCDIEKVDLLTQIPDKLRRARKYKWKVTGPEYETESPVSPIVMNCGYGFPKELQKGRFWKSSIPNGSWKTSGRCTAVEEDWSDEFPNW